MAVAFMAISNRERDSVTTTTDATTARLAAEAGRDNAIAQVMRSVYSGPAANPYSARLVVSTNYLVPIVTPRDLTNLFSAPRAPVFFADPNTPAVYNDFRFYLDLNRNRVFDPNGAVQVFDNNNNLIGTNFNAIGDPEWVGVLKRPDTQYGPDNEFISRWAYIALPAGSTLDLNAIHNQALVKQRLYPTSPMDPNQDAFFRNQGVGTWEINLAAFLADLNTNEWDNNSSGGIYQYRQSNPVFFPNIGSAFGDAFALLTNRYRGNYNSQLPADAIFGVANATLLRTNGSDDYSDGLLQSTINTNEFLFSGDDPALPWAGAPSTNRFSDLLTDLFDPAKSSAGFVQRLTAAGNTNSTYDRSTFYRLLAQLGTDSAPESGRMNLNYNNLTTNSVPDGTNFIPWTAAAFFTNAADRMLKAYTARWASVYRTNEFGIWTNGLSKTFVATFNVTNAFGIDRIPVWVSNRFVYTPAVNRLLQLAANLYDASTTNFYPSIFRPVFLHTNGNVFIVGYLQQTNLIVHANQMNDIDISPPIALGDLTNRVPANLAVLTNVYGVPWVVGVKKWLPAFEQFSTESAFTVTRKLEVTRTVNTNVYPPRLIALTGTNQMHIMNITNYLGVGFWNSYRQDYHGPIDIIVRCQSVSQVTNNDNLALSDGYASTNFAFAYETNLWKAWKTGNGTYQSGSFIFPLNTAMLALTNAIYFYNEPSPPNQSHFLLAGDNPTNYYDAGVRPLPRFVELTTNQLQLVIIDYSTNATMANSGGPNFGRIIDYVQFGIEDSRDLSSEIEQNDTYHIWATNYTAGGDLYGIIEQLRISESGKNWENQTPLGAGAWTTAPTSSGGSSPAAQQASFQGFFASDSVYSYGGTNYVNPSTVVQVPYTPTISVVEDKTWQVNDPAVHYLESDLGVIADPAQLVAKWVPSDPSKSVLPGINQKPDRYLPWGLGFPSQTGIDSNPNNAAFKDPLVWESSDWNFPTNVYPAVGWIGRVHRGTPWQTVYLKSTNIIDLDTNGGTGLSTWLKWTGDQNLGNLSFYDATNMAPAEDRLLFDLFTAALNDNATRGQLSVNIAGGSLAAWSAVLSGVPVLENTNAVTFRQMSTAIWPRPTLNILITNIQPAGPLGALSAVSNIMAGIDRTRARFVNRDGLVGAFEHKGDVLAAAQLSDRSPFLYTNSYVHLTNAPEEVVEWLPQQIMSLVGLNNSPRYVIYSWGQTLKPVSGATYNQAGNLYGMYTNYQVVSETATRSVVRIDDAPTNSHAVIESFTVLPPE